MVVVYISNNGKYWERDGRIFSTDIEGREIHVDEEFKENVKAGENFVSYYMEERNKKRIDEKVIPALHKSDKDWIEVIDGGEGVGKSYYSFQRARYIDNTFNLSRVVFTPEEFKQAIFDAKKGQAIVYDEAFTGLSSRAALSPINKYLISLMMQMRQKNLFVILVLPTFFLLDKYAALFRTRLLTHIYETKQGRRGYWRIYNQPKKKMLFLAGKVTYTYSKKIYSSFKGRFYGVFALGDDEVLRKYKVKKENALSATEKTPMSAGQIKYRNQRDIVIYVIRRATGFNYTQISNLLAEYDFDMVSAQVGEICSRFGDKADDTSVKNKDKELIELQRRALEAYEKQKRKIEERKIKRLMKEEARRRRKLELEGESESSKGESVVGNAKIADLTTTDG